MMSIRTFHPRRTRQRIDYSGCAIPKIARVVNPAALEAIRALGRCEVCNVRCRPHPHHIRSRGAGGGDIPENLVGLCVKHHREAHDGVLGKTYLRALVLDRIERQRKVVA